MSIVSNSSTDVFPSAVASFGSSHDRYLRTHVYFCDIFATLGVNACTPAFVPLTSDLPVCTAHCFTAPATGFAKGTGASCDTFSKPAIFSARMGFVCSNSLHHRASSCTFSVCPVFSITFCTTGDTIGSRAEVTGCNAHATACPPYGAIPATVRSIGFSIFDSRVVV